MKVVINKCYGGFGLSLKGQEEYLRLIGKEAHFYVQTKYAFQEGVDEYKKVTSSHSSSSLTDVFTKDLGETYQTISNEDYEKYNFYDNDLERTDLNLVSVVESLGKEANGSHASLSIIDVPDGVKWTIEEYNGSEHIAEEHKTWG